jgi:hypothetical protein
MDGLQGGGAGRGGEEAKNRINQDDNVCGTQLQKTCLDLSDLLHNAIDREPPEGVPNL